MKSTRELLAAETTTLGTLMQPTKPRSPAFTIEGALAESTWGADAHRNVLVIGAGDVYSKLMRDKFEHRGTTRYIYDEDTKVAETLTGDKEIYVPSLDDFLASKDCPKIDYVAILTPGDSHLEYIEKAFAKGLPVIVEKPVVVSKEDADKLEELLKKPHPPIYCIDWAIEHAKPLLQALGVPVSFPDTLETTVNGATSFDIKNIASINARWLHRMSTSEESAYQRRTWTADITKGGGQLYDNGVHMLNPLAVAGLEFAGKPVARLGGKYLKGVYKPITNEDAEEYVRIDGVMQWRPDTGRTTPAKGINTTIEVGWNSQRDEYRVDIEDISGNILRWEMYPNRLKYLDKDGNLQKEIAMKDSDCYDRVLAHATEFVTNPANENQALYAAEHIDVIRAINEMQTAARHGQPVKGFILRAGETSKFKGPSAASR